MLVQCVDLVDVLLGLCVQFLLSACAFVLTDFAVLDELVDSGLSVAANVTDGNAGLLSLAVDELGVFLTALSGHFGHDNADSCTVVAGVNTQVRVTQSLLNSRQCGHVEGNDLDGTCVLNVEGHQLLQRGRCTVVLGGQAAEDCGVHTTGTNLSELSLGCFDGLFHLLAGFGKDFFDHERISFVGILGYQNCRWAFAQPS